MAKCHAYHRHGRWPRNCTSFAGGRSTSAALARRHGLRTRRMGGASTCTHLVPTIHLGGPHQRDKCLALHLVGLCADVSWSCMDHHSWPLQSGRVNGHLCAFISRYEIHMALTEPTNTRSSHSHWWGKKSVQGTQNMHTRAPVAPANPIPDRWRFT